MCGVSMKVAKGGKKGGGGRTGTDNNQALKVAAHMPFATVSDASCVSSAKCADESYP